MNIIKEKLHYYFFNISIILGVILIIFGPPMAVPDENTHFLNAYAISDGQIFLKNVDGKIGRYIPKNVKEFVDINNSKFRGVDAEKYSFKEYYFNSYLNNEKSEKVFQEYWAQDINPISYIFSSTGMYIGKTILPEKYETPYNLLLFGRLFNFIFYITVMFLAIKITPYYKNTMFLLALMPMSIYLGASLSYDALLIPATFLLFSYTLKLRETDKIVLKDIIVVCCIAFLLFSIKQAYAPLILVLFSIPKKNFGNNKRYYKIIAICVSICVIALIIGQINNIVSLQGNKIINENVALQSEFIKSKLGMVILLIINSFIKYKAFYISSFIGILGQLDTNFPMPILIIFIFILIISIIVDSFNAITIKINFKIFSMIAIGIFIYFSFLSMYINWTPLVEPIYGNTVTGIQGRYFIPIAPFLSIIFANKLLIKYKINDKFMNINTKLVYYSSIVFACITTLTIMLRYWC